MSYEEQQGEKSLENSVKTIADHIQLMEKSVKYISGYLKFDLKNLGYILHSIHNGLSTVLMAK